MKELERKICDKQKKHYLCTRNRKREFSSAGLEHLPYKQRVGGSNPSTPTKSRRLFKSSFFVLVAESVQLVAPRQTCRRCISVGELLRNNKPCANSQKVNKFPFRLSAQCLRQSRPPTLYLARSALGFCRRSNPLWGKGGF